VTKDKVQLPLYAKLSLIILGIIAFVAILYIAKHIILPLLFAMIIAIVLHPLVRFLQRIKFNRVIAILISLLIIIIAVSGFTTIMLTQVSRFSDSWPLLAEKFTELLNQTVIWTSGYFEISTKEITLWIAETKAELITNSSAAIGNTIIGVGSTLVLIFLLPVYVFLILYYQPILIEFVQKLFGVSNRAEVSEVINQIKSLIQQYLVGLSIEVVIVACLFSLGLYILGIEYALFLGVLGAVLNLIPYLGAIMGATLPMIIAIITKPSPWYALLVLAVYIVVQFIDNNYIVPKIVASKVKISALVSITAVFAFGTLWGIPGMFLAIPLTGIVKLIFDNIESMKPWGFLLGDTMPPIIIIEPIIKKIKKLAGK
jgi:predicted PurR-regulated permease PerM